jgi:hypothetical protein
MTRIALLLALAFLAPAGAAAGGEFSLDNASAILRKLSVEIGPRPMGSPAERDALAYAAATLIGHGCDTAWIMPMTRTSSANTTSGVAVGIMKGRTGRIIVLGGHIDSAGPEIPGANDDGSGTAVVLEAARALSAGEHESTIVFALFGGEEQGLEGSEFFVDNFAQIDSVVLMLQVDMANGGRELILDPNAHGASAPAWLVRAAVEEFDGLGYSGMVYPAHFFALNYSMPTGSGSDHEPFLRAGIPALDFTTDVEDPIHTPQDSWENFDPSGLKRSGDLVLRLIARFDGGTPDRATSSYWMRLVAGYPLIVPEAVVWAFLGLSIVLGGFVLLRLRRSHAAMRAAAGYAAVKWTGVKFWCFSVLAAALGWMTPDLVGLLKGVRFPWYAHPEYYYGPSLLAAAFGLLLGARISRRFGISGSPYVLYKRSFIALTALVVIAALIGPNVAVAPAACMALLSAALLFRAPLPAAALALLAPVWMFRIVFPEPEAMLFRYAAPQLPGTWGVTAAVNAVWVLLLSTLLFAWLPGVAAVIRSRRNPWSFIAAMRSRRLLVVTSALFGICVVVLLLVPSYEHPWYPDLAVEQVDWPGTGRDTVRVRGTEYLTGAAIGHGSVDTVMPAGTLRHVSAGELPADVRWLETGRQSEAGRGDSATAYDVTLRMRTPFRPYTLAVTYSSARGAAPAVATGLRAREKRGVTTISWYSYPDTAVDARVRLTVQPGDTVTEEITATFDSLMVPVNVRYREANVRRRTIVRETHLYPFLPVGGAGGEGAPPPPGSGGGSPP